MPNTDVLIAGHGIAGALLARSLRKLGNTVLVADPDTTGNTASRIAAGMFTPITGRVPVKTWLADTLFPLLHSYYSECEKETGASFYHPMPVYRPFPGIAEQNALQAKAAEPAFAEYIDAKPDHTSVSGYVPNTFGGFGIKKSGYVDTVSLLNGLKNLLLKDGAYLIDSVKPSEITVESGKVHWKGRTFGCVVFCTGFSAASESIFSGIPFTPLKGETLSAFSPEIPETNIINGGGVYVVPISNHNFRVGATYEHTYTDALPSPEGLEKLQAGLNKLLIPALNITGHFAGLRPAIKGRRPVAGFLPHVPHTAVFNGLGTKGVSLAPFFAEQLAQHIAHGTPLMSEADVNRFYPGTSAL